MKFISSFVSVVFSVKLVRLISFGLAVSNFLFLWLWNVLDIVLSLRFSRSFVLLIFLDFDVSAISGFLPLGRFWDFQGKILIPPFSLCPIYGCGHETGSILKKSGVPVGLFKV